MTIETNKKIIKENHWTDSSEFAKGVSQAKSMEWQKKRKKEKVYLQNNVTFNEMKWNEKLR